MNKIVWGLILSATLYPNMMLAQDSTRLSSKMEMFKEYCRRVANGFEQRNVDELIDCISQWMMPKNGKEECFVYRDTLLRCKPMDIEDEDFDSVIMPEGHLLFMPAYIDTLIINDFESINTFSVVSLCRGENYDCMYAIRALAAHDKASYIVYDCAKITELFVIPEFGGMINLYVEDKENSHSYSDTAPDGKMYAQLKWDIPILSGKITVTVENVSNKEISFILVRN